MFRSMHNRPSLAARMTAGLAIALVLLLTVLASSPELHERLHGRHAEAASGAHQDGVTANGAAADDDDGCIVTLFAQGIVLALALLVLAVTGRTLRNASIEHLDRLLPEATRYLHLPTQAPPLV
jgi:hypothetical protein